MKKSILVLFVAVASLFTVARAQGLGSYASSDGWQTFYLQYNPTWGVVSNADADDNYYNNFTIGYSRAIGIAEPLYFEFGGAFTYYLHHYGESGVDLYDNIVSLKVPLNIVYDVDFTGLQLRPYAGLYGRFNLAGKEKMEYQGQSKKFDLFDDGDWKRFQIGFQVGVNVALSDSYYVGLGYALDFSPLYKVDGGTKDFKGRFSQIQMTVGYTF